MYLRLKTSLPLAAIVALLILALPAYAQDPERTDFQIVPLSVTHWDGKLPVLLIEDEARVAFYPAGKDQELTLTGTTENGSTILFDVSWPRMQVEPRGENHSFTIESPALTAQIDGFAAPIPLNARGTLACNDEGCESLSVQMAVCSTGSEYQLGFTVHGSIHNGELGRDLFLKAGEHALSYADSKASGYFTAPGTPNPICGGRDMSAVFAEDYIPAVPAETEELPARGVGEQRVDTDFVLEQIRFGVGDDGATMQLSGYFFGQCACQPGYEFETRWDAEQKTLFVRAYRILPQDAKLSGGFEPITLERGMRIDDDATVNLVVNGQPAGVHDIHMHQGS